MIDYTYIHDRAVKLYDDLGLRHLEKEEDERFINLIRDALQDVGRNEIAQQILDLQPELKVLRSNPYSYATPWRKGQPLWATHGQELREAYEKGKLAQRDYDQRQIGRE